MRKLTLGLAMLAAASTMSGCVIGAGPVVSKGPAQQGDQQRNEDFTKKLLRPSTRDAVDLVERYLDAAADKPETRLPTLRTYMKDQNWTPGKELNIYRVFEPERGGESREIIPVTVPMQKIGILKDGKIEPVYGDRIDVQFNVVEGPDGYLLDGAPAELMMDDDMLGEGYESRPLYLWDNEEKRLVPDLRYIPRYTPPQEKALRLVEYLYQPPSKWLDLAVKTPVGQWPPRANPVHTKDGNISIDLQNPLGEEELARLATQLERMLVGQDGVNGVEFKIQGVPIQHSRIPSPDTIRPATRFAVQQAKVVRLDFGPDRGTAAVPLTAEVNKNVEWALFSREEASVALSQREGGVQRFLIGRSSTPKQVTMSGNKPVDQAAWLGGGSDAALVLSNRTLYEVVPGPVGAPPKVTPLAGSLPGPVTGFSVVPDGRIALVIDKKFYMAALYRNGEVLTVTQAQQVPTALDEVQHVALMRTDAVIAGKGVEQKQDKLILTQIYVDGARQDKAWKDYQALEQISHLVTDFRFGAQAYYDYNGTALQLGPGGASPVRDNQVVKVEASPMPSVSATPPPSPPITAASFEG